MENKLLSVEEIDKQLFRPRERVKKGEANNPAEYYTCLNTISRLEEIQRYAEKIKSQDKEIVIHKKARQENIDVMRRQSDEIDKQMDIVIKKDKEIKELKERIKIIDPHGIQQLELIDDITPPQERKDK